ncbi:MAG TPA: beta-ketoacyl-ACP synthase [Xanthobacteraceae bacterium]|nr:beta-ketoacyl-ACP synthase [Xanthobacteraceae bacterium]
MNTRREVWITGAGLLSCLGEGVEATWQKLATDNPPAGHNETEFAPYVTHPLAPVNFDQQIPKKGDQRQMEPWQRIGVYAAGLALANAGVTGNAEVLDTMDMIIAAGGGERDINVDSGIMSGISGATNRGAFLNERLLNDLRPTLFLAQLPNLLAGNIGIVHGIVGSSRTFMGEEAAGVDALRVTFERVAAGQSNISLVASSFHGTRWDLLLVTELGRNLLKAPFQPVWDRGEHGGLAMADMGAGLVIESKEHAEKRGAKPLARLVAVESDRNRRKPGEIETTLAAEWAAIAPKVKKDQAAVISGASGLEPPTREEKNALGKIGLPVRATGSHIGHGFDTQFLANIAIACETLKQGKLFPASGSGDTGDAPASLSQIAVTSVGNWRGEGLALIEKV